MTIIINMLSVSALLLLLSLPSYLIHLLILTDTGYRYKESVSNFPLRPLFVIFVNILTE